MTGIDAALQRAVRWVWVWTLFVPIVCGLGRVVWAVCMFLYGEWSGILSAYPYPVGWVSGVGVWLLYCFLFPALLTICGARIAYDSLLWLFGLAGEGKETA